MDKILGIDKGLNTLLQKAPGAILDYGFIMDCLQEYSNPKVKLHHLLKIGALIRLKKGLYLFGEKFAKGPYSVEVVANLLYGPSYVSMEWALSFYGMIPERVYTVTSMTLGRNKEYHTPVGDFSYFTLSPESYSIGITQKKSPDFVGGFLIASPEKALVDTVFITCRNLDKVQLRVELLESKRIDRKCFHELNRDLLEEIAKSYRARHVHYLAELVGVL